MASNRGCPNMTTFFGYGYPLLDILILGMTARMIEQNPTRRAVMQSTAALALATGTAVSGTAGADSDDSFEPGERIWSFETGDTVESSPTIVDKTVYFGSDDGNVYALDAETGAEQWRFETAEPPEDQRYDDPGVEAEPKVIDGTVYVGAYDNYLYALDADSGDELWRYEAGDRDDDGGGFVWGSVAVHDGIVYGNSRSDHTFALEADTGDELWRTWTEGPKGGGVAYADGRVFTGSYEEVNLHAFDADTGEVVWEKELDAENCAAPLVHDGVVYQSFAGEPLYGFDAETGDEVWRYDDIEMGINEVPTIWDGTLYVTNGWGEAGLHAVDVETAEREWLFPMDQMIDQTPTVADGVVFAGNYRDNALVAVDTETGEELWRFEAHGAINGSPTVVDGVVFFGTADGYLHAVATGVEGSSEDYLHEIGVNAHHHGFVGDPEPTLEMEADGETYAPDHGFELPYGDWFDNVPNYEGTVDMRDRESWEEVIIEVGAGPDGMEFDPPAVLVNPAQSITFVWTGEGGSHDTVEETGLWTSDLVDEAGYEFPLNWETLATSETRLTETGVHRYVCTPHENVGMKGAIVVGEFEEVVDDLVHYEVVEASIQAEEREPGEPITVEYELEVTWLGTEAMDIEMPVQVDGETVTSAEMTVASDGTIDDTVEHTFDEPGEYDIQIGSADAGTITIESADEAETPTPPSDPDTPTPTPDQHPDTPTPSTMETPTPQPDEDSIPGFGILAGLSGLGGAAYVLKRRLSGGTKSERELDDF